jgi:hypothetical protein
MHVREHKMNPQAIRTLAALGIDLPEPEVEVPQPVAQLHGFVSELRAQGAWGMAEDLQKILAEYRTYALKLGP